MSNRANVARNTYFKGETLSAFNWNRDEHDALFEGIYGGLSWAEIHARIARRKLSSIKTQAFKAGMISKASLTEGVWPIVAEDEKTKSSDKDGLLSALQANHTCGDGELKIPTGHATFVGLYKSERSLTGSYAQSVLDA